jgi:hypothetical protein
LLGIHVVPALGKFGPLLKTLFPSASGSGASQCPIPMLAVRAAPSAPLRLTTFRAFRDGVPAAGGDGARLVELYYRHASVVSRILAARPRQARRATAELRRALVTVVLAPVS